MSFQQENDLPSPCESLSGDFDERVVEGRGDSSVENSIIENFPKEMCPKNFDDSGVFNESDESMYCIVEWYHTLSRGNSTGDIVEYNLNCNLQKTLRKHHRS